MGNHIKKTKETPLHNIVRTIVIVGVVIIVAGLLYRGFVDGRRYFRRRNIRMLSSEIRGYGILAPVAVFSLIFISTIVPPIPIPIPLLEIAAGYIFGFWEGAAVAWISEILSSLGAFELTRMLGRHMFRTLLSNRFVGIYKRYIEDAGPTGIVTTRAFMAAPMNIVSFVAGLTNMRMIQFIGATAIGTIPEIVLYPYAGLLLKTTRFSLWRLSLLIVLISALGPICSYVFYRFVRVRRLRKAGHRGNKPR